ncbi:MAG: serine/threonine protein kinase [Iphinoe sp. HA4291-MV1]|jgi:WD40 repeat protein/tRNA A-37 threonylcarbamoyl transferase component Bud32|nr:serine/threonine protein kinase [Iphinoe sp. HA4291-MV1]
MLCCLNPDCLQPLNPKGITNCQSCGAPLVPLLRGHYRVIKVLSDEGGFGRTYLAEDVDKLNERCVVKQLAPKVQGTWALKKAIESFQQEAQRLQELGKNSQIPTLLAYFEEDNYLYLVQEFIDGQTLLKELRQRGTYHETEIREVLLNLLPILKFIHERGVIHRDIKPQNIMRRTSVVSSVSREKTNRAKEEIVLIDFGASKQLSATVRAKPGTTIGTRGYSPLEQLQDGEAHPASDLFSLGATCFHLMSGVSPALLWTENGYSWVASWQQYLKRPISADLAEVFDKLLKKDIHERYQSVDEVIKDLAPQLPSLEPPILRNKLLAGAAIILLGFGGFWYINNFYPLNLIAENNFRMKTLNGHSNLVTSVAISPIPPDSPLHKEGLRGILVSSSFDTTLKLWNLSTGKEILTLEGNAGSVHSVATSPDGRTVASGNGDKTIKLWNLFTGQEIRTLYGHSSSVESLAISPDSKMLASGSFDGNIKLWELSSGREIATLHSHSGAVKSVAFSPNGQTLASGSEDKTIKLWNLKNKQVIRIFKGHSQPIRSVAISPIPPDSPLRQGGLGGILASSSADDTIKLWDLATGQEIYTFFGHSYSVNSVAFTSDGKTLASGSSDHTIKLWDVVTKREIRTLKGHSKEVTSVAFSADGNTLVSGCADGTINLWRVVR